MTLPSLSATLIPMPMKLELIVPVKRKQNWKRNYQIAPLGMMYVAALTPLDIDVTITDENIETIDFDKPVDLVGITSMTAEINRAYEIAGEYRKRGVKVVMGGIHPSLLPDEAIQHSDAVVVGEAEGAWHDVINDFKKNRLKKIYSSETRPSLENMVLPRRDIIKGKRYLTSNIIQTTRGCPFSCTFCTVTKFFGNAYRCRPVADVIREVESLDGDFIVFIDDNILANPKRAKELFRALIPYKKKWVSQSSINLARDDELLRLAAKSGCMGMFIGIESFSQESLRTIKKSVNQGFPAQDSIKKIQDHGILVEGAFIFGLDGDNRDTLMRTVDFAVKMRLAAANFFVLTPFPGTSVREQLEGEGRIIEQDWSRYNNFTVVFRPKQMSPEELQETAILAKQQFFSYPSIIKRHFTKNHFPPTKKTIYSIAWNIFRRRLTTKRT
ncbi:MAG: radical SAM protein [Nitrospirota bacterium]